jgi:hypothetical protein
MVSTEALMGIIRRLLMVVSVVTHGCPQRVLDEYR